MQNSLYILSAQEIARPPFFFCTFATIPTPPVILLVHKLDHHRWGLFWLSGHGTRNRQYLTNLGSFRSPFSLFVGLRYPQFLWLLDSFGGGATGMVGFTDLNTPSHFSYFITKSLIYITIALPLVFMVINKIFRSCIKNATLKRFC